jgi:hypothetical protein
MPLLLAGSASTSRATVACAAPLLRIGGAAPRPLLRAAAAGSRRRPPPAASRRAPPPEDDRRGAHEERLGPQAVTSLRELKEGAHWAPATVLRNDAVSLDGGSRMLHLSIADDAPILYGRKVQGVLDPLEHKWVDSFTTPGVPPSPPPASSSPPPSSARRAVWLPGGRGLSQCPGAWRPSSSANACRP